MTFPTMNPSTKMLETGSGAGVGGAMLLLLKVVLPLVLRLVVVVLEVVVVVKMVCVGLLVVTVGDVLVVAADVKVVATVDISGVVTGVYIIGADVFLLGSIRLVGRSVAVVVCVTGTAGFGQRVVL